MIPPTMFRPVAALALAVGLFLALPGCGDSPKVSKDDKKDQKDNTNANPKPNPNPNPEPKVEPIPKPPEKIDTQSGVGKEAMDFLTAVGKGEAKAHQLSTGFLKAVGLPTNLPSAK